MDINVKIHIPDTELSLEELGSFWGAFCLVIGAVILIFGISYLRDCDWHKHRTKKNLKEFWVRFLGPCLLMWLIGILIII